MRYLAFSLWIMLICALVSCSSAFSQTHAWRQTSSTLAISAIAVSPNGDIFAGTQQFGVFRSTDEGHSWEQTALTIPYIAALAINSEGHIFASHAGYGMYRSTDNGQSWTQINNGLVMYPWIFSLAANAEGHIFAGGDEIYRSTDAGNTWTQLMAFPRPNGVRSLAITSGGYVFAGTLETGVLRSTDNGASWRIASSGLTTSSVLSLAVDSIGNIFAGGRHGRVCHSTDNGESWNQISPEYPYRPVQALAANSSGHIFAGIFGAGVSYSLDQGKTWLLSVLPDNNIMSLAINASGYVFVGTYGGMFRSTDDGKTWVLNLTPVEELNGRLPEVYSLSQNYPNPFNPSTTIEFSLPRSTFVTLCVYDLLGRQVAQLVSDHLRPGRYRTDWNADQMASGVYLYRIVTQSFTATKTMLLLR